MKPLLCAFLWLLPFCSLCDPVWASEMKPCTKNMTVLPPEGCEVTGTWSHRGGTLLEYNTWLDHRNASCLAQMEAAMRAMEPFLSNGIAVKADDPEYAKKVTSQSPVFVQWLNAKRACWGQP